MSRSSKGPRRDLQVLKRLKEASSNPALLLQDGNALLEKADKIKGFLTKQKSRTNATSGKSEWLIVYQHLQDERETCERELAGCLSQLAEAGPSESTADAIDCLAACRVTADDCRALRAELRLQVMGVSRVHSSLRTYAMQGGLQDIAHEADVLKQEIHTIKEDLNLQICQLQEDADRLTAELAALQPLAGTAATAIGCSPAGTPKKLQHGLEDDTGAPSSPSSRLAASLGYNIAKDEFELEDMVDRYPLASEAVKHNIRKVHQALQERFLERLETWRVECEAAGGALGLGAATGGWAPEEHSQFVKLREHYYKEGLGTKGGRAAALARMAQLLPGRDHAAVLQHDDWYVASLLLQRRRRDAVEAWGRERRQFLQDSECFLEESARANQAQAEAAADRLAHELVREQVHDELEGMRATRAAEWEAGAEARAAAEAEEKLRQAEEMELRLQDRAMRKDMIAAYRQELDRQLQEEQAEREARERAAAQERAQQGEVNRGRVEFRTAVQQWKVQEKKEEQQARLNEEQERQRRLDRLRALVAPNVEADPLRVLQPTVASAGTDEEERELAAAAPFRAVNGYTVTQLYRDPKFKIMDALQRQGLHNTDYGRQVISNAQTVKATRPDNLTYLQRG